MTMMTLGQARVYPFLLVDLATGQTGVTGETPTVQVSKNGGAFASIPGGQVTEIGLGWYKVSFLAGDVNTAGYWAIVAEESGVSRVWRDMLQVVNIDVYSSTNAGLSNITSILSAVTTGVPLTSGAIDSIWDEIVEQDGGAITTSARKLLRALMAHATGETVRVGGNIIKYRSVNDVKDRVIHTVTPEGDRTNVTLDLEV